MMPGTVLGLLSSSCSPIAAHFLQIATVLDKDGFGVGRLAHWFTVEIAFEPTADPHVFNGASHAIGSNVGC